MAEKILNIDDYRKKTEDTEMDIQIEDPFNFLSPSERDEYLKAQNKAKEEQQAKATIEEPQPKENVQNVVAQEQAAYNNAPIYQQSNVDDQYQVNDNNAFDPRADKYQNDNRSRYVDDPNRYEDDYDDDEDYEDEDYDDDYDDRRPRKKVNPEKIVRIASIVTGILILILVASILKANVFDKIFGSEEAETEVVSVSLPRGYTATNDTVVATADVNIRSVPSTESSDYIVTAIVKGTELKRLGVSDDGYWAYVEYNGQQLYCSMKYLEVKQ